MNFLRQQQKQLQLHQALPSTYSSRAVALCGLVGFMKHGQTNSISWIMYAFGATALGSAGGQRHQANLCSEIAWKTLNCLPEMLQPHFFSGVWTVAFWCCYYQTPLSWEFLFDLSMAGLHVQCEPCIHCPTEVQFFVPAIARVIVLWADCEDPMATGEPARHQVWPADAPVTSPLSEGFSFNVSTRRWLWLWGYEYLVQKIELHMNLIFDRPVYCRQTVFRLKFRLFCRLYTVGRL